MKLKIYITPNLALFLNYSGVMARVLNPDTQGHDRVIGVPKRYIDLGVEWDYTLGKDRKITADLTYQYLGKAPLNAQGTIYRYPVDRYLLKLAYKHGRLSLSSDITYHPKKFASEAMFISGGFVRFDPKPKWDINLGLKYDF